ncbi:MAG TPA: tetratricopeptide repeat protein [Anaeromyxobacteraceae bacterium]|nr:tetratricopeptide repeat protein [Anaeromyxobacteraceae bacterium]
MRATVLRDPAFVKQAGRFVWLDVDTERPESAAFLEAIPIEVWPSFLVVDFETGKPVLKWLGTATAEQLARLLEDGARAVRRAAGESAPELLALGDRANAEGRADEAVAAWRRALEKGGPTWDRRPRVVESLVLALAGSEPEACARLARAEGPRLPRGQSFANVAAVGLSCALDAPEGVPWGGPAVAALEPLAREALSVKGVLADDRAGLYDALVRARQAAGDKAGARSTGEAFWRFLEGEGRRARTPAERASLDSWRVSCAIDLGDPARAVPRLRASERALPGDYNPPARLALLYLEAGRFDDALAAADRALARVYGPRRLRVLDVKSSILEARGDRPGARAVLEEAVAFAAGLPPAQRNERAVARLEARLQRLGGE